jgi:hypothetical protein
MPLRMTREASEQGTHRSVHRALLLFDLPNHAAKLGRSIATAAQDASSLRWRSQTHPAAAKLKSSRASNLIASSSSQLSYK